MRRLSILLAALSAAGAASAQAPTAAAPAAAPEPQAQIDLMRQQLLAGQQLVLQLRRELADEKAKAARLVQCEARNARLVDIGNKLIDGYQRRYANSSFGPFKQARRRFEEELQATGDEIYQNRSDAVARPAAAAPAPSQN